MVVWEEGGGSSIRMVKSVELSALGRWEAELLVLRVCCLRFDCSA